MSSDINDFVGAGFLHYATAVQTTARFVSELQNLLAAAIESEPDRVSWRRRSNTDITKSSGSGPTPWINVSQQVSVAGFSEVEAKLVVGYWWRPDGTVMYTHFGGGPDHCKKFSRVEGLGIRWHKESGLHYFLRSPSSPVDVQADVRLLLDHVDRVVRETAPKAAS